MLWRNAGGPKLHAATVDHGLRPAAREEAGQVAAWAQALGVPHTILTWTGDKPSSRLQELAREARYRLLEGLATDIGADVLMTGHHADDQVETVLFRLLRGSGIAGLAGMAVEARRGDLRLVRPLLGMTKAALIAVCETAGQPFFRDPSNEDPRFARTGLRRLVEVLAAEGLGAAEIVRLAGRAARAEEAMQALIAGIRAGLAPQVTGAAFEVDGAALADAPREALLRIIEAEIIRIGGGAPRLDRLESLSARVAGALRDKRGLKGSLGGALVEVSRDGRLSVRKAPPRRETDPVRKH